jgi:hypothetical protein
MNAVTITGIEKMIYVIRGQKVMLDSDLAQLYEVETRSFNQAVKRNLSRFPEDFMFQLTEEEATKLRRLTNTKLEGRGGRRHAPLVFTESGVAMLSSVLTSERAAQVNISIIRTFVKLRSFLAMQGTLDDKVGRLEKSTNHLFKIIFERLDNLEDGLPAHPNDRKRIGLKPKAA